MATSTRSTSRTTGSTSRRSSSRTDGSTSTRRDSTSRDTTRRASTPSTDASPNRRARDVSRIKHYTFRYNLDRVSRKAGSSNLTIASNGNEGALTLSIQEARSLYNFLDRHFNA
jgi:hypothetical protein